MINKRKLELAVNAAIGTMLSIIWIVFLIGVFFWLLSVALGFFNATLIMIGAFLLFALNVAYNYYRG